MHARIFLERGLDDEGFDVQSFGHPDGVRQYLKSRKECFDAYVLDIRVHLRTCPSTNDGIELCAFIHDLYKRRNQNRDPGDRRTPLLYFLTGAPLREIRDRIEGLGIGAIPLFHKSESYLKVAACIHKDLERRHGPRRYRASASPGTAPVSEAVRAASAPLEPLAPSGTPIVCGPLHLAPDTRSAFWDKTPVPLTDAEFDVVACLAEWPNDCRTKEQLQRFLLDCRPGATGRNLKAPDIVSHIRRIRQKFIAVDEEFCSLVGHYGRGYSWTVPTEPASEPGGGAVESED